jgi:hypothetical protein
MASQGASEENAGTHARLLPPKLFLMVFVPIHSAVSAWLLLCSLTDSSASPTAMGTLVKHLSNILLSPVFTLFVRSNTATALLPGPLGWLPVFANSTLWAFGAWWLFHLFHHLRVKQRTTEASNS